MDTNFQAAEPYKLLLLAQNTQNLSSAVNYVGWVLSTLLQ